MARWPEEMHKPVTHRRKDVAPARRQRGAALLLALLIAITAGLGILVGHLSRLDARPLHDTRTDAALRQGREALIGFALAYPEDNKRNGREAFVPGHLPCPDLGLGTEGQEAPSCGGRGVASLGRLPWRSLGLPPLRDDSGECLWYAVAGDFKANPKAHLLNSDTPGGFIVRAADGSSVTAGATPPARAIAVLFAAGPPVSGQARSHDGSTCGGDTDASHFLEMLAGVNNASPATTPDTVSDFISAPASDTFNDRLVWITADEVQALIQRQSDFQTARYDAAFDPAANGATPALAQRAADCLAEYGRRNPYGRLPWAAPVALADTPPDSFDNDRYDDATGLLAGRVPNQVRDSFLTTGSSLASMAGCAASGDADCRLFRTDNCNGLLPAAGYPTPTDDTSYKDSPDGWFDKWKDHLYYAVASDFTPAATAAGNCSIPANCLYVDGNGPYAALILESNQPLSGQSRYTHADRNLASNYVEGGNVAALTSGTGFTLAGNDRFVCIRPDLTIDANCGGVSTCATAAATLLSNFSGQANSCNSGGSPSASCSAAAASLSSCSCASAASAVIATPCLQSLAPAQCQQAVLALQSC